ncbi:MAG: ribosome maturation factor RimM [Solirubrobacteraceae bacterium]
MAPAGRGWLRAGRVGRPHGLDGSFYVVEPSPQLLGAGASVVLGDEALTIVRRAGTDKRPIVRLEGCEDRPAAEGLRNQEIWVPRTAAPELEPDEWWADDLEGCTVRDGSIEVGTVRRLRSLPSCEVLEVQRADDRELLVPFVRDAVREVDLERRVIDVDLKFLGEV